METQTRTKKIEEQMKSIQERIGVEQQSLARATKRKEMAERFDKLISASDLETRTLADDWRYNSHFWKEKDPAVSRLYEYFDHYNTLRFNATKFAEKQVFEEKRDLVWEYITAISHRRMAQETYESILVGTEPSLGKYPSSAEREKMYAGPSFLQFALTELKDLGGNLISS